MRVCVFAWVWVFACLRVCVFACLRVCVFACLRGCLCVCVWVLVRTTAKTAQLYVGGGTGRLGKADGMPGRGGSIIPGQQLWVDLV